MARSSARAYPFLLDNHRTEKQATASFVEI